MSTAKFTGQEYHDMAAKVFAGDELKADRGTLSAMLMFAAQLVEQHWMQGVQTLTFSSIVSGRTKEGRVELILNKQHLQMDLKKAREVMGMLSEAIEAAATDQMIVKFFSEKFPNMTPQQVVAILQDFREMRQGTRDVVFPS